ncbi:MAG: glycosyltransferase family 39 protein, partial [Anaerolineae bacterium]
MRWTESKAWRASFLFAVTVLTRLPFTSHFLYNWDSVQYALGTENYDITYHQPHPPGYLLYVAAGKALNLLTDNPNQSFILLSILASGLAVSSLYLFGARAMGDRDGAYAALLLLFNPVFWFYGEITSTYALECLMAILIGWTCFRVRDGEDRLAPWVGVLLGIAGGIRQGTV